jgi:hypothetical protein
MPPNKASLRESVKHIKVNSLLTYVNSLITCVDSLLTDVNSLLTDVNSLLTGGGLAAQACGGATP